jgi:hypothetical protein
MLKPMSTTQYLHGTQRADWSAHVGACLTDDESAALASAAIHGSAEVRLYAVDIDLDGLVVADLSDEVDRDAQSWPGDTERGLARLRKEGYDVVTYQDETEAGREMLCVRLISDRAVAAARSYEVEIG